MATFLSGQGSRRKIQTRFIPFRFRAGSCIAIWTAKTPRGVADGDDKLRKFAVTAERRKRRGRRFAVTMMLLNIGAALLQNSLGKR